eukprot:COSAG06_NODE_24802_length_652_cov_0.828210_1_plen_45_part_10
MDAALVDLVPAGGGETAGVNKQQVRRLHRVTSLQLQRDLGLRVDV